MGANQRKNATAFETDLGGRPEQQDDYLIYPNFQQVDQKIYHLFGIFDGHGSEGRNASKLAKELFQQEIHIQSSASLALKEAFIKVHEKMLSNENWDPYLSGTTAVIVLMVDNQIHVAHVGDSRLALIKKIGNRLETTLLTEDHNCDRATEKARVLSKGARVEQLLTNGILEGPLRVFKGTLPYPGITVTRSLGDGAAQRLGVICEPEITSWTLGEEDKYLLLATDGLWDGLNEEQVSQVFIESKDVEDISKNLMKFCLQKLDEKGLDDNVTHVVISLPFQ